MSKKLAILAVFLLFTTTVPNFLGRTGDGVVRYIVAWLLGVPFGLIVIWYVVGHAACGR
jgi:hypothetical protein